MLIADSPSDATGLPFVLLGYRLDAAGRYQPMQPDAEGRFLSETTGIWFQVSPDGQRIFLFEYPTGRRLLNFREQKEQANREAEKAVSEARARKAAEEKALREEKARKAAEEELARLRTEIERLRGE